MTGPALAVAGAGRAALDAVAMRVVAMLEQRGGAGRWGETPPYGTGR